MAKRLQHRGGTTSQHSTFTGAAREVTVDTDKNTLVINDGATAGGHALPTLTGTETLTNKTLTSPVFSGTATNFTSTGIDDNADATAITINSSEQVEFTAGTALLPAITTTGDANTGMWFPDADTIAFSEGGSEAMRIDTSGNVGIGTSSPSEKLEVSDGKLLIKNTSGAAFLEIVTTAGGSADSVINFGDSADNNVGVIAYEHDNNALKFITNTSERMRIDSSGNVLINTTTAATSQGVMFGNNGQTQIRRGSLGDVIFFINSGSGNVVGKIRINAASTSYTTTSDYRLKGNVSYDFDATTRLKQLKPARFNFIADADTTVDGFIAHEVQSVIPEAISGEKDAVETKEKVVVNANGNVIEENIEQADWEIGKIADEDGNTKYPTDSTWEATKVVPDYQGIDQSKLVPLLVKTIQELEARITALETTTP